MILPSEKFEVGNVYTVRVELLRVSASYEFSVNPYIVATINGKEAYISYINANYVIMEYTFPIVEGHTVTFTANGGTGTMNPVNGVKQPDGGVKCLTPRQAGDLLGHSTSQITEMYYVKRDNTRLVGITDSFEI